MILLFTGNGKGKTTAAIGQAIRALGQGKKVLIIQFIKGPWKTGEDIFASKFQIPKSKFQIIKTGKGFVRILGDKLPFKEHKKAAEEGLKLAKKAIKSKKYDLIILDEINNAVDLKLIKASDVLKILRPIRVHPVRNNISNGGNPLRQNKNPPASPKLQRDERQSASMDLILTGRNAPKSFVKIADIATEMKELKHPFQKNKKLMKKGIEY